MRYPVQVTVGLAVLVLVGAGAPPAAAGGSAGESAGAWRLDSELDMAAVEQYLGALDRVELEVDLQVGGGSGDSSPLGPLLAKLGTELTVEAEFDASGLPAGERAGGPVITRLKVGTKSGEGLRLGPLALEEIEPGRGIVWLGSAGEICLGFDLEVGWFFRKNFREMLCVESAETTAEGAVEFNTRRSGLLAKWVVPELRISPEGVVEKKGLPFLRWVGGWRPLDPKAPRVPMPLPIHDWPIRLPDLLDWLPVVEGVKAAGPAAAGGASSPGGGASKPLPPIPVPSLALRLDSRMESGEVSLAEPAAALRFSDHRLRLEVHGGFDGRTFRTDPARPSSLAAGWMVAGTVDDPAVGRLEIAGIRGDLDGSVAALLPLQEIERREVEVEFGLGLAVDLASLDVRTEEGIAVSLPTGLRAEVEGRGAVTLPAGSDKPRITLEPDSRLALTIPGPLSLDRPAELSDLSPALVLQERLNLAPASAEKPLLSVQGKVGSSAAAGVNLLLLDASFALAGVGRDEFGLRPPGGLRIDFGAGTTIGLEGQATVELGLEGLQRVAGARLGAELRLPAAGGELSLRTVNGLDLAGTAGAGGWISFDTGPMAATGAGRLATSGPGGRLEAEMPLRLGGTGRPSVAVGAMRLDIEGDFAASLDLSGRKAEPRRPLLDGPLQADLRLGLDLEAGFAYRPPDRQPVIVETPTRLELGLSGAFGAGVGADDRSPIRLRIEKPAGGGEAPQGR